MDIRIVEEIKELLYDNGYVVIPGLGTFKGSYKSASIDNIQGSLAPPSLDIEFNPDNVLNDGLLVDHIKNKYQVGIYEAQKAIDNFTEEALNTFKKHEILLIPDVGRLYRDYTDKVRFLTEKTNFNTDSFGLPTVNIQPLSRTVTEPKIDIPKPVEPAISTPVIVVPQTKQPDVKQPEAAMTTAETVTSQKPRPVFPESTDNIKTPIIPERPNDLELPFELRKYAPGLAVALVLVLAYSIYLFNDKEKQPKVNEKPSSSNSNMNQTKKESEKTFVPPPPTQSSPVAPTNQNPNTKSNDIASEKYVDGAKDKVNADTREGRGVQDVLKSSSNTKSKADQKAILVIGGFANQDNVNKLKSWVRKNGYVVYEKKSGDLTLVGAEVTYSNQKELNKLLKQFRDRYGDGVVVRRK